MPTIVHDINIGTVQLNYIIHNTSESNFKLQTIPIPKFPTGTGTLDSIRIDTSLTATEKREIEWEESTPPENGYTSGPDYVRIGVGLTTPNDFNIWNTFHFGSTFINFDRGVHNITTGFDGVYDFGGTSGDTINISSGLITTFSRTPNDIPLSSGYELPVLLTDSTNKALFSAASGNIDIHVNCWATNTVSQGHLNGSLVPWNTYVIMGFVRVTYTYH